MSSSESVNDSIYPVKKDESRQYLVDSDQYKNLYKQSVENNEAFWAEQANMLDWTKPFSIVKDVSLDKADLHIRWFEDGE